MPPDLQRASLFEKFLYFIAELQSPALKTRFSLIPVKESE
jgi:hypothetical protein